MAERTTRKGDIFKWWNSDRSGFQFGYVPNTSLPNQYSREQGRPIRDNGVQVAPDEYDQPPPSNKPLGGTGEIGVGARANSDPAIDSDVYYINPGYLIPVQYLSTSSQIRWNDQNYPIYITGSNQSVTLTSNPQLTSGQHGKVIAIMGVGSNVTINSGSGITFDFNVPAIVLDSGAIATLIYNATDSLWHLTSFTSNYGGF